MTALDDHDGAYATGFEAVRDTELTDLAPSSNTQREASAVRSTDEGGCRRHFTRHSAGAP